MLSHSLYPSSYTLIASVSLVFILTLLVKLRHLASDFRIKRLGGVRAPILAGNLLSASKLYYEIGKNQYNNQLVDWCTKQLDNLPPGKRTFAEFSLTGSKRVLITRDPEQIKAILATNFSSFGHGPMWHRLWRPFLGDGIFGVDGQLWHDSRSMIRPMFARDRLRNLAIFEDCTSKLLRKIPSAGATVELKDLFYRWALDTTTEFLLGENVNSLDFPDHDVFNAMHVAQRIQMYIFVLNPIAPLIPKGNYHRAIRRIEEFIEPAIARALAIPPAQLEELSKSDLEFSFLHSIARYTRDPKAIRDQIMSVLLAGRDTTAATLSWAMYELSHYPEIWAKLRSEVLAALGNHGTPTYETLKDLKYVRNILSETLRLHPAAPLNMRQALETTTIPGRPGEADVVLLKGDSVTINTLGMHMCAELYPPTCKTFADPRIFSPERWESWTPKPWTYLPFSGGPRICAGQNFALTEMAFCLVRLAQRFESIEYRGDWAAQKLQADIIGTPALGIPMALYEPGEMPDVPLSVGVH
ncbi:cytochrome P450 alkane hydroxylase [Trichoderma reesei RUT C-30]|uniref:Cytochrome P450 alkane hydroxylase n=2 Tax=Hypocrea jecorina TaxID=51453 RepID=A0A024S1I0_HYPJR|nr:cytochrome P450 alkane hydroxylase [Trichoderma reesei RUT C-30]